MVVTADAIICSEVISPFRSVRMFYYLAFIASTSLEGLIATSRLISALANPARSGEVVEILTGLTSVWLLSLHSSSSLRTRPRNAQMARLSREENLTKLKMKSQWEGLLGL